MKNILFIICFLILNGMHVFGIEYNTLYTNCIVKVNIGLEDIGKEKFISFGDKSFGEFERKRTWQPHQGMCFMKKGGGNDTQHLGENYGLYKCFNTYKIDGQKKNLLWRVEDSGEYLICLNHIKRNNVNITINKEEFKDDDMIIRSELPMEYQWSKSPISEKEEFFVNFENGNKQRSKKMLHKNGLIGYRDLITLSGTTMIDVIYKNTNKNLGTFIIQNTNIEEKNEIPLTENTTIKVESKYSLFSIILYLFLFGGIIIVGYNYYIGKLSSEIIKNNIQKGINFSNKGIEMIKNNLKKPSK